MFERFLSALGLERRSTLADRGQDLFALFGAVPTSSGVSVSADNALRSPATLAAVRVIAEAVGSLPIHLFRRGDDGARERDTTHPAAVLLGGDWCPWAGSVETRTALQVDALLHGAGYAQVIRTGDTPRELHRLDPTSVTHDLTGAEPVFYVQTAGQRYTLRWQDVVYLPTPGSAPGRLVCLLNLCREAVGLDVAMASYQGRLFANGARPSGIIKYEKMLGREAIEKLRDALSRRHTGSASGSTMVLEDGMTFEATQFSSVDLQFLELRKFTIQEIGRAFKVPGTLIGDLDRATWRNIEELGRQFLQFTLLPWLEVWTAGLSRVLLTPTERQQFFVEFAVDDLMRADLAARFAAYWNGVGGAWLTPNDARRFDNMPPVEGGDTLIMQAGQTGAAPAPAADDGEVTA